DGVTLTEKYGDTPLSGRAAAELVEALARILHYAHQRGIVHCNLTPGCVLLAADGTPKVTRFGLARMLGQLSEGGEEEALARRLPSYLAPEQIDGQAQAIHPTVDVYGLGAILYKLLTGRPPFVDAAVRAIRAQVLTQDPQPPSHRQPDVPHELDTICLKCLHKAPRQRYPSAEALAKDLQRFLAADHSRSESSLTRLGRTAVPGYVISGELGRSSRGTVYKALQVSHQRIVALKVMTAEAHV